MANSKSWDSVLKSLLTQYKYPDMARRDILSAFQSFTDLRPKTDTYVFNDGNGKELLCLEGTIPVTYKGNTYNIPVCLWLMDTHPYNPPLAHVRPTSSMLIKPGRHVDTNGRVYLPYLHEWKHPHSDLQGLIQVLVIIFSEEPPVFSRPAGNQAQPPTLPARPSNPYPAAGQSSMPTPFSSNTANFTNPTPGYPTPRTNFPSYPPSTTTSGYPPSTTTSGYPPSTTTSGYPPSTTTSGYQAPLPYPGYTPPTTNYQTAVTQASNVGKVNSLSEEQIKASLKSAVEDKMRRRLREVFAQSGAEMEVLSKTEQDLQAGKVLLEKMLDKLEKEQNEIQRNSCIMSEKLDEIRAVIRRTESREQVDLSEAVAPTTPLYRQLFAAYAEEQATQDAIYYLSEGLRKDVIELDVFLKKVRGLSRKQFMLRALIQKCRQKANLS